ncbi:hypothetical protein CR513_20360, partial [Mucuna pruriens]
MDWFLHGLNTKIQDIVELYHYSTLEKLDHQATKGKEKERGLEKIKVLRRRVKYLKAERLSLLHLPLIPPNQVVSSVLSAWEWRTMVLRDNGEVDSWSSTQNDTTSSYSEKEYLSEACHYEDDLHMVRMLMSSLTGEEAKTQGETIFHPKRLVLGKLCSLIINGGSSVNPTLPHPRLCKLPWLSEKGELVVDKQVPLAITLGSCKDDVVCDIFPMEATHILLGRPWQYDRKLTRDGITNRFSFDQGKMKKKREEEKKGNDKVEKAK